MLREMIQEAAPGLESRRGSAGRVAATALLVSIAYYGFILRIPPSTRLQSKFLYEYRL